MILRIVALAARGLLALALTIEFANSSDLRIATSSEPSSLDPHFLPFIE